jgi:hypothetical protein
MTERLLLVEPPTGRISTICYQRGLCSVGALLPQSHAAPYYCVVWRDDVCMYVGMYVIVLVCMSLY